MKKIIGIIALIILLAAEGQTKTFSNGGTSTLATPLAAAAATLILESGASFPQTGEFDVYIFKASCSVPSSCSQKEIVTLTLDTGNVFTVVAREQEGTTMHSGSWPAGSKVHHAVTAGWLNDLDARTENIDSANTSTFHNVAVDSLSVGDYNSAYAPDGDPYVDARNGGLAAACTAAASLGRKVLVSDTQTLGANLSCAALVEVVPGGTVAKGPYTFTAQNGFSAGLYTTFTGTGLTVFTPGTVNEVYPQWWGGFPGGGDAAATATTTAINAALASVRGSEKRDSVAPVTLISSYTNPYTIDSPIVMIYGDDLHGNDAPDAATAYGVGAFLQSATTFSGDRLINMNGYQYGGSVKNIGFLSTAGSGIAAIKHDDSGNCINYAFGNLYFEIQYGLMLMRYSQSVVIENLFSQDKIDTLLYLSGNRNMVRNVNKENGTGTTAGAYIVLNNDNASAACNGNELSDLLIEGTGNAGKYALDIEGCSNTGIQNFWNELTITDGYSIKLTDVNRISFRGVLVQVLSNRKIKMTRASNVNIELLSNDADASKLTASLDMDRLSDVTIERMYMNSDDESGYFRNLDVRGRIKINQHAFRYLLAGTDNVQIGVVPTSRSIIGSTSNMLKNGGFEAGAYGWNQLCDVFSSLTSSISPGLMSSCTKTGTGINSFIVNQSLTVSAGMVGQPLTFTGHARITDTGGGTPYAVFSVQGGGLTATNYGANKFASVLAADSGDSGWKRFTQTIIPQSTATLYIGIRVIAFNSTSTLFLDDLSLSPGIEGIGYSQSWKDIVVNGNIWTSGTAAPTTGTWTAGDYVRNSAPAVGQPKGWYCTVTGTPGTWVSEGNL
jgi:hypothetical protein